MKDQVNNILTNQHFQKLLGSDAVARKKLDGITSSESTPAKMNFCINCERCSVEDTWLGERYFCILEERKEEPDYDYVMGEVINTEPITRRKKMLCRKARGTLRHCPYFVLGVPTIKTKEK